MNRFSRTSLFVQAGDLLLQFLPLRGGDAVDDFLILLDLAEDFHLRAVSSALSSRFPYSANPVNFLTAASR